MTLKTRIIPVVTWDGAFAVNTRQFRNPQSVGSMTQVLSVYERRQCDELVLLDINATRERREPKFKEVCDLLDPIFCPVAYGGGITQVSEVWRLISSGVDKVIIGSGANPSLIDACRNKFGSQSITVAMDVPPFSDQVHYARDLEKRGAGEILLTSIDAQGTRMGYDTRLIEEISKAVQIPVIANGGCGKPEHMVQALAAGAHAVAAGTMFAFTEWTPRLCAQYLRRNGFQVRMD